MLMLYYLKFHSQIKGQCFQSQLIRTFSPCSTTQQFKTICFMGALADNLKSAQVSIYNPILLCMSCKIFDIGLSHSEVLLCALDKVLSKWLLC